MSTAWRRANERLAATPADPADRPAADERCAAAVPGAVTYRAEGVDRRSHDAGATRHLGIHAVSAGRAAARLPRARRRGVRARRMGPAQRHRAGGRSTV